MDGVGTSCSEGREKRGEQSGHDGGQHGRERMTLSLTPARIGDLFECSEQVPRSCGSHRSFLPCFVRMVPNSAKRPKTPAVFPTQTLRANLMPFSEPPCFRTEEAKNKAIEQGKADVLALNKLGPWPPLSRSGPQKRSNRDHSRYVICRHDERH